MRAPYANFSATDFRDGRRSPKPLNVDASIDMIGAFQRRKRRGVCSSTIPSATAILTQGEDVMRTALNGVLAIWIVAFTCAASAAEIDGDRREAGQWRHLAQAPAGTRLFNAVGTHTCQSRSDIGYKCDVRGQFTSL
jgi:hypothetical protein